MTLLEFCAGKGLEEFAKQCFLKDEYLKKIIIIFKQEVFSIFNQVDLQKNKEQFTEVSMTQTFICTCCYLACFHYFKIRIVLKCKGLKKHAQYYYEPRGYTNQ